jgi:hypothetical protein
MQAELRNIDTTTLFPGLQLVLKKSNANTTPHETCCPPVRVLRQSPCRCTNSFANGCSEYSSSVQAVLSYRIWGELSRPLERLLYNHASLIW